MADVHWVILNKTTKEVINGDFITDGAHPKNRGFPYDALVHQVVQLAAAPNTEDQTFNTTTLAYADDLAKVQAHLIGLMKQASEAAKMQKLSAGGGKKFEYNQKKVEVSTYNNQGLSSMVSMLSNQKLERFPFVMAELNLQGVSPSDPLFGQKFQAVIDKFAAGQTNSVPDVARFAAIEQKATADIMAATTVKQARNIAAAVVFNPS